MGRDRFSFSGYPDDGTARRQKRRMRVYGGMKRHALLATRPDQSRQHQDMRVAWVWKTDSLMPKSPERQRNDADHGQRRSLLQHGSTPVRDCGRRGNRRNAVVIPASEGERFTSRRRWEKVQPWGFPTGPMPAATNVSCCDPRLSNSLRSTQTGSPVPSFGTPELWISSRN